MCLRFVSFFCMMASLGLADTLTMRDGKVITGSYLGGDSRTIRMAVGDRVETYSVDDVSMLQFSSKAGSTATPPARPAETGRQSVFRPERPPTPATSTASGIELSAGTQLTIRMIDDVDSERDRLGQTFKASLDEPVTFGSDVAIPRGADVVVKLVEDKQSGKIQGQTVLTLDLQSVTVNGKVVDITTEEVSQSSESRGAKSGKVIGGATALGAIIGAIAGGGKGAAIGAVSGAGAGTAVQVATKGQRVRIPSETRLTFTLQNPVRL